MASYVKKTNGLGISTEDVRICIVMVGLPARGKSLIARKGEDEEELGSIISADIVTAYPSRLDPKLGCVHTAALSVYCSQCGLVSQHSICDDCAICPAVHPKDPEKKDETEEDRKCKAHKPIGKSCPKCKWKAEVVPKAFPHSECYYAEHTAPFVYHSYPEPYNHALCSYADSYIRLAMRYFKWLGIEAKVFNVGEYRRTDAPKPSSNFFDATNEEGAKIRRHAAEAAMKDMIDWFEHTYDTIDQGTIAIFDATNSTKERRRWIADECAKHNIEPLYIESFCDDEDLIKSNIREVKLSSPDYKGLDPEVAVKDFQERIKNYEKVYQSMNADGDEKDLSYTKITNVGASVMINQVKNYLQSRIVYYLMNLHIRPRSIWLSRHGESEFNLTGQIGGDALLSERGQLYARKLPTMIRTSIGDDRPLTVWTSTLRRTIATAAFLPPHHRILQWKALDELDAGVCDGLTYAEIAEKYPEDFKARDEDKYNYRYMGGESYKDVVTRLEPIIMELERGGDILIVTHQAVLRCVLAYFIGKRQEESPWMNVPLHTLIKLTPRAYATDVEMVPAHIEAVSTWRGKGSTAKHEMVVPEEYDALKG